VHGDLRVVGTGLDADVATADLRAQGVSEEGRQVLECLGFAAGQAEPVLAGRAGEHPRPETDRDRQAAGRQIECLTGVLRRRLRYVRDRAALAGRFAASHPPSRHGPCLQQRPQFFAVCGVDVEGREVQAVLGGGDDPGLMRTVELGGGGQQTRPGSGTRTEAPPARLGRRVADQEPDAAAGQYSGRTDPGQAEQPPPGQLATRFSCCLRLLAHDLPRIRTAGAGTVRTGQPAITPATLLTSSASALIASEST